MKKFKFLPPYREPGKTTFPATKGRSGVYIIKEEGKIVYVGMSAKDLYRTLYRHFEAWNHSGQEVITYQSRMKRLSYTVRVILCTPNQAYRLEKYLIIKNRPRDNRDKYSSYEIDYKDEQVADTYWSTKVTTEIPF